MYEKLHNKIQNKKIEYDNVIYYINEEKNKANAIGCKKNQKKITIPRSINVGSKEYEITSIMSNAFCNSKFEIVEISSESKIETIEENAFSSSNIKCIIIPSSVTSIRASAFSGCSQLEEIVIPNDSKLKTIEENAFCGTSIKSITIPSELTDLQVGWCSYISKLTKITVSPKNPRYCCFDEKLLIEKTNINQDNYDCLIFCVRDLKHIQIPNFIKNICTYSFNYCYYLEKIIIPSDSKLETIEQCAFSYSRIRSIIIPSSITSIKKAAFYDCFHLEEIIIPSDSKLQIIERNAFCDSVLKSITIPSELINLKKGWCYNTSYLTKIAVSPKNQRYCCYEDKMIIGKTNINQDIYDCLVFCVRDIKHIQIPNFIKNICSYSFEHCKKLEEIIIPSDSKIETIGKCAYSYCNIKSIIIPSSVTCIGDGAFAVCQMLQIIEINNPEMLYDRSFRCCRIALFMIPVE